MPNGDIFNRVELISYDEPRDLAVLKINAANLTPATIASANEVQPGEKIWIISTNWGKDLEASLGSFKERIPAEVATNKGKGFSLLEISYAGWLAPSQIALDSQGRALGLIIDSIFRYRNFASPLTDIADLTARQGGTVLGSGAGLRLSVENPGSATEKASQLSAASLAAIAKKARTIRLDSRTKLIPTEPVEKKLLENSDFAALGLVIVKDDYSSDLTISLDRPVLTWDFTYTMTDRRTQAVLGSGKIIAWDGVRAAAGLAEEIVKRLKTYREQAEEKPERREPAKN